MNNSNVVAAPQMDDVSFFSDEWDKEHIGDLMDFYRFMTSPTPERNEFLAAMASHHNLSFEDGVAMSIFKSRG